MLLADRAGRDSDGFLNTPVHTFTSSGYALVFDPVELRGQNGTSSVDAILGDVRVHATGSGTGGGVFVGIGPADAVESYLATVDRERLVGSAQADPPTSNASRAGHPPPRLPSSRSGSPRRPELAPSS